MTETKNLKEWIALVARTKKLIQNLGTKDRLETTASIAQLHISIKASLEGWSQWLRNPNMMNHLNKEELKETFEIFKSLANEFLDLDLKMSRAVLKKAEKRLKEKKKKKESYIS